MNVLRRPVEVTTLSGQSRVKGRSAVDDAVNNNSDLGWAL